MAKQTGVQDFLTAVVAYVEGNATEMSEEDIKGYFHQVRNARGIMASFLVATAFKEMKHLINLLDSMHTAEAKLFSADVILKTSPADLNRMHEMLGESIERTFNMISIISQKLEHKNLQDFKWSENLLVGGTAVSTPTLAMEDIRRRLVAESYPRETRDRLRGVLTKVMTQYGKDVGVDIHPQEPDDGE